MTQKTLLILVDGMRPDGLLQCGHSFLSSLLTSSSYTLNASTIMPSMTLPCHTSLFFSVDPGRHGITTNTWMPPVRPIDGITEVVHKFGKKAAMIYNWEELRDLARPGSLAFSHYECIPTDHTAALEHEHKLSDLALSYIYEESPDFLFLYLGYTDIAGHNNGWMTPHYLEAVANASHCIEKIMAHLPKNYNVCITADHGGHRCSHGTDCMEDMTIPLICHGPIFQPNHLLTNVNIKDIAPTLIHILGLIPPSEWKGSCLLES